MSRFGAIPFLVVAGGGALVWAAVANMSPVDLFRSVVRPGPGSTSNSDGPAGGPGPEVVAAIRKIDSGARPTSSTSSYGSLSDLITAEGIVSSAVVGGIPTGSLSTAQQAQLVSIGQGGHRLWPSAAASFARWERVFGRTIILTDSFRSTQQQQQSYETAVANGDPDRFAEPGRSWHERGLAVDINLGAIGAGGGPGTATYDKLRSIGQGLGWCFPRAKPQGDGKEPWHASYGGCG